MTDLSSRPTYHPDQLSAFHARIKLASIHHPSDPLSHLALLQKHCLATIPFENTTLHYSPHHTISLDPTYLFHKIVERKHGGYCMENNCFFGTVLRSLGFEVYSVGARVSEEVERQGGTGYNGWSHMLNIVTIASQKYMVDIGFGANAPTSPLLLHHEHTVPSVHPSTARLVRAHIPNTTNKSEGNKQWIFQSKSSPSMEWVNTYAFTELEFLPQDYEMMNFWTSKSFKTFFNWKIMVVRYLLDEEGELIGRVTLVGQEVKRKIRSDSEVVQVCETEEERVKALEEFFGIVLREEEKRGILGTITALKKGKG